jgi:hypothetical protein
VCAWQLLNWQLLLATAGGLLDGPAYQQLILGMHGKHVDSTSRHAVSLFMRQVAHMHVLLYAFL